MLETKGLTKDQIRVMFDNVWIQTSVEMNPKVIVDEFEKDQENDFTE